MWITEPSGSVPPDSLPIVEYLTLEPLGERLMGICAWQSRIPTWLLAPCSLALGLFFLGVGFAAFGGPPISLILCPVAAL